MKAEREGDKCMARDIRPKETGGRDNCRGKEILDGWKGGRKSEKSE